MDRLHAVARGDRAALHDVHRQTSAKLFGVCLRILPDREEAEDVLQDVYLTVWNKAERFNASRASPVTWLATIARNRAIDRLRVLRQRSGGYPVVAATLIRDDAPSPLAALEADEDVRQLVRCLEELEEPARSAIVSAFYNGRTYADLASAAAVPLSTMKSTVRRGLQSLRRCLEA